MANTLSCPLDRSSEGIKQHAKKLKESLNKIPEGKTSNLKLSTADINAIKEVTEKIEEYRTKSKGNIIFNPKDHSYTIRTTEGEIKADYSVTEWGEVLFGKPNIKGDYSHSQEIGTSVDKFGRAYLGDKNPKSDKDFLEEKKLKDQFEKIKNKLKEKHGKDSIFITAEMPMVGYFPLEINGKLKNVFIGGTPDLIVVDNLGKVHIYDFKVKKKEDLEIGSDDLINYAYQQNAYSDLFKANTGIEVESVNLIWFHTNYPKGTVGKTYKIDGKQILYKGTPIQNTEEWKHPTFVKLIPLVKEEVIPEVTSLTQSNNTKKPIISNRSNKKISIGTRNVTKESVRSEENKNKAFVFTENLQALVSYTEEEKIRDLYGTAYEQKFPTGKKVLLDVRGKNNQASIRAYTENKKVHIIPNTFGIVTKRVQQFFDGEFIYSPEGNFQDSELEFERFKAANNYIFEKLKKSGYEEIVFPDQMALGKSALPRRFAEWLQKELRERFGVDSELKYNNSMKGWGLRLITTQERAMEFQYEGNMSFIFGKNKRDGIEASSTLEAIIEGKRTATTRYESEDNLDYWKNVKKGDIIRFHDKKGRAVYVRATEDAKKLSKASSAKKWSEKEGWSEDYFNREVKPKLEKGKAIQIEFEYVMSEIGTITQEEYFKQLNDKKENEKNIKQLKNKNVSFSREEGKEGNRYAVRTETNIKESDITIAFANNWSTAGEQVTEKFANENKKPYIRVNILKTGILPVNIEDRINDIVKAITKLKKDEVTINIAGNGIYTLNIVGISQEQCNDFVYTVLHRVQDKLKKSKSKVKLNIRSGGQTGADEAGIVAAMALKLPSKVHTTKKWKFKNIEDKDVLNEKEFIERFSNSSSPELIEEKSEYEDDYELLIEKHMHYTDAVSVDLTDSEVNVQLLKASLFEKIKDKFEGVKIDINTLAYLYQVTKAIVEARNADVKNRAEFKDIPAKELNALRNNFAKEYYDTLIEYASKGEFNEIEKIKKNKSNPYVGLFIEHFKKDKEASLETIKENIKEHAKSLEEKERRANAAKESEDNLVVNEDSYISKIEGIYHTFDPETLKKRTSAIATSFRRIFDTEFEYLKINLTKTITDYETKSKNRENIPVKEFNNYVNAKELLLKISDPINGQVAALNALDPKKIFKKVKAEFESDLEDCKEELDEERENENEEKIFFLERRAGELEKFIDNFDALAELSISDLEKTMQCRFTEEEITNTSNEAQEEEEENEEAEEDSKGVVRGNDGWSYKARLREGFNTASKKVKELLGKVHKCDYNGNPIEDDMGVFQTESADYQHRILTEIFAENVIESKDFAVKTEENGKITYDFPVLEKYKSKYPWIQSIIKRLKNDPSLVATFYSDFRQDYYNVTIFTYDKKEKKYKIFSANDRHTGKAASEVVINNWLDSRIVTKHIKDSIYDSTGVLNYDRVNYIISTIEKFKEDLESLREGEAGEFFHYITGKDKKKSKKVPKKWTRFEMARILQSMGVSADSSSLGDMDSFEELMKEINTIVLTIQKDKMTEAKDVVNGKHKDLYVALKKLPILAGAVDEFAIRPTFYESGQTYPNYATPNNVSTLCKTIRNREKREAFLEKLKQVDFLYDKQNGKFKSKWFRDLAENMLDFSVMFDYSEIFKINNKTYDKWTRADKQLGIMSLFYFKEGEGTFPSEAWYRLPLFSDSQACMLIKQQTYSTEECVEYMAEVALQELDRMTKVEEREPLIKEGEIKEIANYDANGHRFHFLPELNDLKLDCGKTLKKVAVLIREGNAKKNGLNGSILDYAKEAVEKVMEGEVKKYVNSISEETAKEMFSYLEQEGYFDEVYMDAFDYLEEDNANILEEILYETEDGDIIINPLYEYIKYYQYNNLFAQSQIYMLTITDLAYYANMTEVQKRFKQEYASGRRPFTQSKYGKETERVIYLKDNKRASRNYDKIKKLGVDPELVDAFLSINTTDAQAYRTITSYRSVQDMFGNWDETTMNPAMERLLKGEATIEDLNVVWQIIKPFLEENIVVPDGLGGYLRVKHQHKNSEFLLLAMHDQLNNILNQSSKLKGLNEFMEENNIDCAMFNSAVKSGCQGVIDIRYSERKFEEWLEESKDAHEAFKEADKTSETFTYDDLLEYYTNKLKEGKISQVEYNKKIDSFEPTAKEVYDVLSKEVFKDSEINPEVVHEFSYENYREAQPNPEHLLDSESTIGSQWGNYIISDLPEDIEITLEGKKFNKEEIVKLYNWLRLEDSIQGYAEAKKIFENKETLHKELVRLIQTNPNYSLDLLNALELVKEEEQIGHVKKNFRMPLVTPSMLNSTVSMLFSIFRNKISKPTIKGGAAVLVSSFGFYDNEHKKGGYKAPRIVYEKGKVKAVQCYLPAYSKQMYEPFLDKKTKTLDFTKMPEELRIAIGYRIPTEDKYSMLPLEIIGFLPPQNGSAIVIPEEIVTIAGIDFDVDKAFLMRHEFRIKTTYNLKEMFKAFYTEENNLLNEIDSIKDDIWGDIITDESLSEEEQEKLYFEKLKESSMFKRLQEKGFKVDTLLEVWKENQNMSEYIKKISVEKIKYNIDKDPKDMTKAQRHNLLIDLSFAILTSKDVAKDYHTIGNFDQLIKAGRIVEILSDVPKIMQIRDELGVGDMVAFYNNLRKMSIKKLNSYFEKDTDNPLSDLTYDKYHHQNMQGAALISHYAIGGTAQAKYQHTELALTVPIKYNGRIIERLHDIYIDNNKENPRISEALSQLKAASVDNAKNPQLYKIMQNPETAYIAVFMTYLGMSVEDIALIFNSPGIKNLIEEEGTLENISILTEEVNAKSKEEILEEYHPNKYDLVFGIINDANSKYSKPEEYDWYDHVNENLMVWMENLIEQAQSIRYLNSCTRSDSPNGSLASTLSKAQIQKMKIDKLEENTPALEGASDIVRNDVAEENDSIEEIREKLRKCKLPFLQGTYTLGVDLPLKIMKTYIPHLRDNVYEQVKKLDSLSPRKTVTPKVLNEFYKGLTSYVLAGAITNYNDARIYFIEEFPSEFAEYRKTGAFRHLPIIQSMSFNKKGEIVCDINSASASAVQEYTKNLDSLLFSGKEGIDLAKKLFLYSYFKDGVDFTPTSYGKCFSTLFWNKMTTFMNELRNMEEDEDRDYSEYLELFIINHFHENNVIKEKIIEQKEFDTLEEGMQITIESTDEFYAIKTIEGETVKLAKLIKTHNEEKGKERSSYIITEHEKELYNSYYDYYEGEETEGNEYYENKINTVPLEQSSNKTLVEDGKIYSEPMCE